MSEEKEEKSTMDIYPETEADLELMYLIRAKFSLIYVVTWEERRVIQSLERIANRNEVNVCGIQTWDAVRGLTTSEGIRIGSDDLTHPMAILDYICRSVEESRKKKEEIQAKETRGPIFVLCDFFRFLEEEHLTAQIERKLRYMSRRMKRSSISVIITSPELEVPLCLEKSMAVLDYPVPEKEALSILVKKCREVTVRANIYNKAENDPTDADVARTLLGLTIDEAQDALAKSVVVNKRFDLKSIIEMKRSVIRKSKILDYLYSTQGFDDIGGMEGVKQFVKLRKAGYTEKGVSYGLQAPKGIFLLGVQGTGKSLIAKGIANMLQQPLVKLDLGRVFARYVGESESNIRRAILFAEQVSPCVLLLDEIDKSLSTSSENDGGTSGRVLSSILDWMQEKTKPVFIVACANSIAGLNPAALRKGRFDEVFFVDLPKPEERKAIFEIHIKKRKRDPKDFNLQHLVTNSEGFSGAEIASVVEEAMYVAFAYDREFETRDIMGCIKNTKPLSVIKKKDIDMLREESFGVMKNASEVIDYSFRSESSKDDLEGIWS